MSKPKRKAKQQNFLQYFLNEFILFRRDFSFVTHLSVENAAKNLRELNFQSQGCWRKRRILADVVNEGHEYSFEIKTERPSNYSHSQSAKATGMIFTDDDGMTIIEGSDIMGGKAPWLETILLLPLIFSSIYFKATSEPVFFVFLPIIICGVAFIFWWVQMYRDRNHLVKIIENAVLPEKAKTSA